MPNRSNKNLAKMKDNYGNKMSYAQLVEVQSPEPQEFELHSEQLASEGAEMRELATSKTTPGTATSTQLVAATSVPNPPETSIAAAAAAAAEVALNNDNYEDEPPQIGAERGNYLGADGNVDEDDISDVDDEDNAADELASMLPEQQQPESRNELQQATGEVLPPNCVSNQRVLRKTSNCNNNNNNCRKVSLSNSQVSTCFVSTSNYTDSRRSSSIGTGSLSVCYNANNGNIQKESPTISYSRQQQQHQRESNRSKSPLKRTISSSMLELDKSLRMDKFEVSWNEMSFNYEPSWFRSRRPTQVLRNISGKIKSNQLVALIGPSGCGKTTLLRFLAGNNPMNRDKLRIYGLEEPKVAYIGQDDGLLPGLTARETLIYASRLQNNNPKFNHEEHILPILSELGLSDCADRSVTKLSGGQIKRVTIAQELLYPTNLLILDEVTSGLDASTSYSIVKLLKHLVSDSNYPMSIVISIHQPSAKLFSVFDQVYVMANGGCLYEGSCEVDVINTYLGRFNLECPKFNNIADYLIEVATNDDLSSDKSVREQMIQYQQKTSQVKWEQPLEVLKQDPTLAMKQSQTNGLSTNKDCDGLTIDMIPEKQKQDFSILSLDSSLYDAICRARNSRPRPLYKHFCVHLSRSFLRIRRSYILTYLQLVTYILLGLQLATFYGASIGTLSGCPKLPSSLLSLVLSQDSDDQGLTDEMRRIQENMNFLLVAVMTATFAALEITVITFPLEAKTVKREWRNGWYRVSSYFMGRTVADLPFQLSFVVVFCALIYAMTGQAGLTTWRFGSFVGIMVMVALVAQSVGFTFGAIFMDNLPAAVFTAPLCVFPALLFSGFFSRVSQIPQFYLPMTYLSHFRYAFDALLVTLYGYDRCQCDQQILSSYNANLHNQTNTVKDMFKYLFGSADCDGIKNEDSIEDTVTSSSELVASTMAMNGTLINATSTMSPLTTGSSRFKSIEDALVDSVFDHMNKTTEAPIEEHSMGAMDHLAHKFSSRITSMINRQSNYGHEVPQSCDSFNSYLMTEFDLKDEDLFYGLVALFVVVIVTRVICNVILNFTIASRAT